MIKTVLVVLMTAFLGVFAQNSFAEIYKWVDEAGRAHFTDRPPNGANSETVTLSKINTYASPELVESPMDLTESRANSGSRKRVVMYSAEWCGVCRRAKAYFRKQRIPFSEYDIEKSEKGKREFKKLAGKGVPVILVGKKRMNGFSVGKFEQMYGG